MRRKRRKNEFDCLRYRSFAVRNIMKINFHFIINAESAECANTQQTHLEGFTKKFIFLAVSDREKAVGIENDMIE